MFHAQKIRDGGQGVAHGDAQMTQKHLVFLILSCDVATPQEGGTILEKTNAPILSCNITAVFYPILKNKEGSVN